MMFRQWIWISLFALIGVPCCAQGQQDQKEKVSEQRVALVIGNAAYDQHPLKTPTNDADTMATALKACGFTVLKHTNLNREEMIRVVQTFTDSIKRSGVGLFYYSGHGFQVDDKNYLVPVDTDIQEEANVESEYLAMTQVLNKMETADTRVNILILDAGNLTAMNTPSGTFITYATYPGQQFLDGTGSNSFFTAAFAEVMHEPGLEIKDVFWRVRKKMIKDTANRQVPWASTALVEDFYFVSFSENAFEAEQAYERGRNNYEMAEYMRRKAIELAHPGMFNDRYYKFHKQAIKWFRKAVEQGHPDAQNYLTKIEDLEQQATDFTLQPLYYGASFNLYINLASANLGNPIFLNFWATWCPPCISEMPDIEKLQQTLGDSILIVGINQGESADTVREFVHDREFFWTFVLDPDNKVALDYNASVIPTSVFINDKGVIVRQFFGQQDYETFLKAAREAMGD